MKKVMIRFMLGSMMGIVVGYAIAFMMSAWINDGNFYLVNVDIILTYGNELNAVMVQTIISMLVGGVFGAASLIFENNDYSIAKQTMLHFVMTTPVFLLLSSQVGWMPKGRRHIISYLIIYLLIYIFIWVVIYLIWKHKINKINQKINQPS